MLQSMGLQRVGHNLRLKNKNKTKIIGTENRIVVSRGERKVVGKIGEGCQDAQTSTYE